MADNRENKKDIPMTSPDLVKKVFFRRRRSCPLSGKGAPKVDYKDVKLLTRFISERGKIMPKRITAVSSKKQRELARAVKRARILAILPFVEK